MTNPAFPTRRIWVERGCIQKGLDALNLNQNKKKHKLTDTQPTSRVCPGSGSGPDRLQTKFCTPEGMSRWASQGAEWGCGP